jgi:hypothetical protein
LAPSLFWVLLCLSQLKSTKSEFLWYFGILQLINRHQSVNPINCIPWARFSKTKMQNLERLFYSIDVTQTEFLMPQTPEGYGPISQIRIYKCQPSLSWFGQTWKRTNLKRHYNAKLKFHFSISNLFQFKASLFESNEPNQFANAFLHL